MFPDDYVHSYFFPVPEAMTSVANNFMLRQTRPIFHQWDATIRGHVFCLFLASVLFNDMERRLGAKGWKLEWEAIRQDLEALAEVEVRDGDQRYLLRSDLEGEAGKVLQAVGVAIPPRVLLAPAEVPKN